MGAVSRRLPHTFRGTIKVWHESIAKGKNPPPDSSLKEPIGQKKKASNFAGLSHAVTVANSFVNQPSSIQPYLAEHSHALVDFFCAVLQHSMALLELALASSALFWS
jgi:hypothetical protein